MLPKLDRQHQVKPKLEITWLIYYLVKTLIHGLCVDECKYFYKYRAIFPLDNDAKIENDLLVFNWKFIYIYDDHLSVFKAKN